MIAIKGFEIPKKCIWDCPFCNGEGGACELADIKTSDINRPLDCPLKEVHEADNEARLKADMVAMLTELKNKFIDKSWNIDMYEDDLDFECCYLTDIDEIIQEKINSLKGENNGDR